MIVVKKKTCFIFQEGKPIVLILVIVWVGESIGEGSTGSLGSVPCLCKWLAADAEGKLTVGWLYSDASVRVSSQRTAVWSRGVSEQSLCLS